VASRFAAYSECAISAPSCQLSPSVILAPTSMRNAECPNSRSTTPVGRRTKLS
jgi:hypothetical protein